MTDEMKTSKLVKDVKSFLEDWMALSEIEKAQVKGYVDCLRSATPAKPREQKTAQEVGMEEVIRSLEVDFDRGVLRVNGKEVTEQTLVYLPGPDGWELSRLFNPDPSSQVKSVIKVAVNSGSQEKGG